MKELKALVVQILVNIIFTTIFTLQVNAQQIIKLTYALFQPPTAAVSKINTEFAKEIEKRSGGKVQITVFQGGSLLTGPAMLEGVKKGIADMGNWTTVYSPGVFPFTSIVEIPVNIPSHSHWVASYAMYDFISKYENKEWKELKILTTCGTILPQVIATSKKPVKTLEDLRGLSLRTNDPDITTALGATVKNLPMAEVYDGISKGVIDGVHANFEPFKSWRLAEVVKYITLNPSPFQNFMLWANFMNMKKWESLPPDIQKIILEVGREYVGKIALTWEEECIEGLRYAKSKGVSIYVLPKEEVERWTNAIVPVTQLKLKRILERGFSEKEVQEAIDFYKNRIKYWEDQMRNSNIVPLLERIEKELK
uniref:TRAP transporter substrate-binding protein n=1 Tax=candidate division WOR-3 bacterium TaxID=2052148 RepID=A0A7C2K326_UNCW3